MNLLNIVLKKKIYNNNKENAIPKETKQMHNVQRLVGAKLFLNSNEFPTTSFSAVHNSTKVVVRM